MAALSSFGHSGTNVHLVVREFVAGPRKPATSTGELVPLSARTKDGLTAYAAALHTFLEAHASETAFALSRCGPHLPGGA